MLYTLNNAAIDRVSGEILIFLQAGKLPDRDCTRIRLAAEEILLKYLDRFGRDTKFSLDLSKRFGKIIVTLKLHCDSFNPLDETEDEFMLRNMLQSIGYQPHWSFRGSCNKICFTINERSRIPSWAVILIAAALGAGFGLLARLLPGSAPSVLSDKVLAPVSNAVMGFLGAISGLLVALSIISGILGMGNVATLNRIGKKLISHTLLWMLILAALLIASAPILFPISRGSGMSFDFETLWSMIIGIVPNNLLSPFLEGNVMQIVFISVIFGLVTLTVVHPLDSVVSVTQILSRIVQGAVEFVTKAMPVVVFISLFNLLSIKSRMNASGIYKLPLYLLLLCFCWLVPTILRVCIKQRVRPGILIKKLLPSFVISASTASSNASLPTSMEICEKELGIDPQLVKVGIPLVNMLNRPCVFIEYFLDVLCMAVIFKVDITWSSLVTIALTTLVIAIAAPPIPGATVSSFTLMAVSFGIPLEAVTIIVSLDMITERISTPAQVACSQLELIQIADKLCALDKSLLRRQQKQ